MIAAQLQKPTKLLFPTHTEDGKRILRVCYIFAGEERYAEMGNALRRLAGNDVLVSMEEHDILRHKRTDLLDKKEQTAILDKIEKGAYDVVISSPPCETFTRAKHTNRFGPPPLRSFFHPYGFP